LSKLLGARTYLKETRKIFFFYIILLGDNRSIYDDFKTTNMHVTSYTQHEGNRSTYALIEKHGEALTIQY
jgi:hypothetical protein